MSDNFKVAAENHNSAPEIPEYLQDTYWWAYLHPKSFYFFERKWVVNLILWGNMKRLTEMVIEELPDEPHSRILQIACVYGEFSSKVADHLDKTDSRLEIVDVAPIQLENVEKKLTGKENIGLHHLDSTSMSFADASFDQTVVFFLLHELPMDVRKKALREVLRVVRPGGKIIFMDYHRPVWQHPHRYLMQPILRTLEPFAMDLWNNEIADWIDSENQPREINKTTYFGGLYQKVVMSM